MAFREGACCFRGVYSHASCSNHDNSSRCFASRRCASVRMSCSTPHDLRTEPTKRHGIVATSQAAIHVAQQKNIYLEMINGSKENSNIFRRGITVKAMRLMKMATTALSPYGYFVDCNEQSNNNTLCTFCENGKLIEASHLIDVMTRCGQIPDFECCINLVRGFVNADCESQQNS